MHEIAFTVGKLSIHWYGVFVALAFVVAMSTLLIERKRAGITPDNVFDLALIAIFGGVFGARLSMLCSFSISSATIRSTSSASTRADLSFTAVSSSRLQR